MIVRILNNQQDTDKFYDCRNSCIRKANQEVEPGEFWITFEFTPDGTIEVILAPGDEIYYMNDAGNTIHADHRMCN